MHYEITIPDQFPQMTVKELLENYLLIPRKIRHFLRTKKHVQVNGDTINWQSPVNPGDLLTLTFDAEDYPEKILPQGQKGLIEVLYEDAHIIIVNKPTGMKTHGNDPTEIALLNHVSTEVGATCYVVHRLDMETSGAVLFAKNPFVLPILNQLLEKRLISRTYLALCQGRIKQDNWTITDKIGRDRHDQRKRLVDNRKGQSAKTHVHLEKAIRKNSLVSCKLETGRTHQIRVHLSHHGHAIVGDPLYSKQTASRLMLHAQKLSFQHPFTLETISVNAESTSFQEVLDNLSQEIS
ncbi:RluA family pseudouridine synthase [Streptococcus merionis]|uniref:Pseudouridine synthase n=1 Tax=Streptococcus merionis TaxID=400065 RepID=A0A239SVV0_9STRE|nr:RluA family pseudouridine synthase [Streptococcus merionis]SNU89635.1 pseudouridine synthase [Streptococcus merionis]